MENNQLDTQEVKTPCAHDFIELFETGKDDEKPAIECAHCALKVPPTDYIMGEDGIPVLMEKPVETEEEKKLSEGFSTMFGDKVNEKLVSEYEADRAADLEKIASAELSSDIDYMCQQIESLRDKKGMLARVVVNGCRHQLAKLFTLDEGKILMPIIKGIPVHDNDKVIPVGEAWFMDRENNVLAKIKF